MDKEKLSNIEKHSAGAIISHNGKFSDLSTYSNKLEITQEFREKWVIPYYMDLNKNDKNWIKKMSELKPLITDKIISQNLGDFNWRTRQTGSFFASIKNRKQFTEIIGNHLLKSQVCYAGSEYAITLSYFNTQKALEYLNTYLDYYLLHPELQFDQYSVISSLKFLDEINNSNNLSKHIQNWRNFLERKKEMELKNRQSFLKSELIPEETKEKLSKIEFDNKIDYDIEIDYITKRIETIKTIANTVYN